MKYIVIDFETANSKRASACSVGIVKIDNGKIVLKKDWLIRPPEMKFNYRNVAIHGIRPEDVVYEMEFDELYNSELKDLLENQIVVAHNASFDISVLRHTLDYYNIDYPNFKYLCTVKIGQKTWKELYNHKLDTLSNFLGFKFRHHDALQDCLACSNVLLKACEKENCTSPIRLAEKLEIGIGELYLNGYKPCSINK